MILQNVCHLVFSQVVIIRCLHNCFLHTFNQNSFTITAMWKQSPITTTSNKLFLHIWLQIIIYILFSSLNCKHQISNASWKSPVCDLHVWHTHLWVENLRHSKPITLTQDLEMSAYFERDYTPHHPPTVVIWHRLLNDTTLTNLKSLSTLTPQNILA